MHRCGSIDYVRDKALAHADQARRALSGFEDNTYRAALLALTELAVARDR